MANGVFVVHFKNLNGREKAIEAGLIAFDRKLVILKRWRSGINFLEEKLDSVPIWVRFPRLNLRFCGLNALMKLSGLIGKVIKMDRATATKDLIEYARVLIEVQINGDLPDSIEFLDENGAKVSQKVVFEWRPIRCSNCYGMGHMAEQCPNERMDNPVQKLGPRTRPDKGKMSMGMVRAGEQDARSTNKDSMLGNPLEKH
ncbi:uncharacterized protein LOC110734771 [Chenopodium quinoa]|uniref:uncharacterized protein LOC110734771 n=1 Tax=Chenopodium quinoa TaxID=63459 RepID=UPI000B7802A4|nr:uncharacterized protein LOC110734771 [Chenopodium quinoa]